MIMQTEHQSIIQINTPAAFKVECPLTYKIAQNIDHIREMAKEIILGKDKRLLVVVGPCSIHDINSALEYASHLQQVSERLSDDLCIVMRTYFEKPRTTLGWRGFLSDPHLDGSHDINLGLKLARKLLLHINDLGLGTATEFLDTIIPHYLADLISWVAMGARTSESQIHREVASGLPMPVGFKNNTYGNVQPAIDAVNVARHPHCTLGISQEGFPALFKTTGNSICHITLRGSHTHPNFHSQAVENAAHLLRLSHLNPAMMIDCSHGNTGKNYQLQQQVIQSVCEQIANGSNYIFGVMIESHLVAGKQKFIPHQPLTYGQSITDACLSWEDTIPLLEKLAFTNSRRR